jgi:hypothetical protein
MDSVAVAEIMAILGLKPQQNLPALHNEENFLVFYLQSPAHLEVSDLPTESLVLTGEEGAKLLIIANPDLNKNYLVGVVGDDYGHYRLTVGKITGGDSSWKNYDGFIESEQTDTFIINPRGLVETTTTQNLQPLDELFADLIASDFSDLSIKASYWQTLYQTDYQQAIVYGYRLRNWLSLLTKNQSQEVDDLLINLDKIEAIISYLVDLSLDENKSFSSLEYQASISDLSDKWQNLSDPQISSLDQLSRLAALDLSSSQEYLNKALVGSPNNDYAGLIWAITGRGFWQNSQILLQD